MQRKIVLVLAVFALATIVLFVSNRGLISGFFGIAAVNEKANGSSQQAVLDSNKNAGIDSAAFNAALSFEVLKKSKISAKLWLDKKIPDCPETIDANVLVENTGGVRVEVVRIKASQNIAIKACSNCFIEGLEVGEKKTVLLKLCKQADKNSLVFVSSANAETIEIKIREAK